MSDRAFIKIGFLSMPLTGHLNPMTPEEIGSLPSNAIVVNNAPQLEIDEAFTRLPLDRRQHLNLQSLLLRQKANF